jgi:hypothetical protein
MGVPSEKFDHALYAALCEVRTLYNHLEWTFAEQSVHARGHIAGLIAGAEERLERIMDLRNNGDMEDVL